MLIFWSISPKEMLLFNLITTKFTFQAFCHQNKSLPDSMSERTVNVRYKFLTYSMLRGSGCWFGFRFHSPLHFLSFSPVRLLHQKSCLQVTFLGEDKSLPTPDSTRFPCNSTPLKSVVVLRSACLSLSAGFHDEQLRGSVVPVRNYAPWTVWLSSASPTDGGMSMKVGQQTAFGSNLFQDLCCAPLPPLCQITLGSHSTLSVGPWSLFSAIWWPHCKRQTTSLLFIHPLKCQNVKYNMSTWPADSLESPPSAHIFCMHNARSIWN